MRISDWSSDVCSSDLCLDMALRVPRERRDAVAAADAEFAQGPRNAMRAIVERGVGDTANTRALPARHDLGAGMPFGGVGEEFVERPPHGLHRSVDHWQERITVLEGKSVVVV